MEQQSYSIYPLSPLQHGMLFNSMYAVEPGIDVIQIVCSLREMLDVNAFERVWWQVFAKHSILRTGFRWDGTTLPTQVVHEETVFSLQKEDWRNLPGQEQQVRLEHYLLADRQRGFVLELPPLLRLALFRCAEAEYYCVVTFHHAILDGRSLPIILAEAFDLYEAFRSNGAPLTISTERPYHDYVTWLQTQEFGADETFWKLLLNGFSAPTPLPAESDLQSAATSGASHAEQSMTLSTGLSQSLRALAERYQLTLNTLIQGAWAFVLSRRSRQADVIFGAVRSCRRGTIDGVDSMIGLFLNTLPVRVQIQSDESLLSWLRGIRAQGVAMRDHLFTSLTQVQQWSQLPGGTPLFESIFVFEKRTLQSSLHARGLPWHQRTFSLRRKPSYPLALYVFAEPEILITFVYDQRRFAPTMLTHLLEHVRSVLEAMVNDPEQCLDALPLMSEAERQQVLVTWNATQQDYPRGVCVHQFVEAQAERTPNALAIQMGTNCWTYRQLNEHANQIAHLLRSLGVGSDTCVGILMERSPEVIVSQLGILKAGGAFLMFDPASPQERLDFLLKDAQVQVLLTLQKYTATLSKVHNVSLVVLDASVDPLAGLSTSNSTLLTTGANLAYIIYTSGSTGLPKGVAIEHNSLVNLVTWYKRAFAVRESDRAMHQASLTFDASILEIWPVLVAGASLHLPTGEIWGDPRQMINWLTQHAVTIAFLTTPLGEAALQEDWPEESVLRVLSMGGDRLRCGPAAETSFRVYNLYGPTEYTILATYMEVRAGMDGAPPIGRPVANTRIYLLDEHLRLVPIGTVGELYIGGSGLARGYRNRSALTAERFIPDPFSQQVEARLYRTGDLARYRHDGVIEYMGRIDHQIKVRGFRIEPGEIESVLTRHPSVTTAMVQARENEQGEKQLVAYLVPVQRDRPDGEEIRRFLRQKLPEYMIPTRIIPLNALPLMPNGKVDLKALPDPEIGASEQGALYEGPRSELENTLKTVWTQVLRIKPEHQAIGIHDNFFELGGHSLLAAQAILRINKLLSVRLSVRRIFDTPTIASLAAYIENSARS